jgi:hypothetical protein
VLVHAVAESCDAADGDSEDFREAAEACVVAFAVFGGWGLVVRSCGRLVTEAGGLRESASMCVLEVALSG